MNGIKQTYDLFMTIFADADNQELVKIWSKKNQMRQFHKVSSLKDYHTFSHVIASFPDEDVYFSFSSFKNRKRGRSRMCDLFNVYAFCVDVDYKKGKNADCSVQEAIMHLGLVNDFLRPAYIEYGNQFRLIYLLKGHLSGKKQFAAIESVINRLVKQLNDYEGFDFCAESQGLNTYLRVAGSCNTKVPIMLAHVVVDYVRVAYYEMDGESSRKTLSEYMDSVLGKFEKPDWYDDWKKNAKKKKKKKPCSQAALNKARLRDVDLLQAYYDASGKTSGYRDKLCFLHFIHVKLLTDDNNMAWDSLLKFNEKFRNPMMERELRNVVSSALRKKYRFGNTRFATFMDLSEREIKQLDLSIGKSCSLKNKEYCRKYYEKKRKKANTKKKQMKRKEKSIIKLRRMKKKNAEICASLHLSMKTLERYLTKLIKEHKILSKKFTKKCEDVIAKKQETDFAAEFSKNCTMIGQAFENAGDKDLFSELAWFDSLHDWGAAPGVPEGRCLSDGIDDSLSDPPCFHFGMSDDDLAYI